MFGTLNDRATAIAKASAFDLCEVTMNPFSSYAPGACKPRALKRQLSFSQLRRRTQGFPRKPRLLASRFRAYPLVSLFLALAFCSAAFAQSPAGKEPSANLQLARQLNQAFIEVAERVSPTVVVITVIQKQGSGFQSDDDFDSLPREFREYFRKRQKEEPEETQQGQGSGIIVRQDGYILTNGHVVEDAQSIEVRLKDGRTFKATLHGLDAQSDVAVIKIDATGLPCATLADSNKTKVGEFAIAIGAPFSLDYTVTFGHVSAKGRSNVIPLFPGTATLDQDFIQTDANINPGNSGGPLVNIDSEVIGINTLIRGLHTGIGFAIPSSLAKEVSDQLITDGKFTRAWLGIGIRALTDEPNYRSQSLGVADGVIVSDIIEGGPAANSELKRKDIITAVEGNHVSTPQQLRGEVRGKKIGEPINLEIFRPDGAGAGKTMKVQIKPAEYPASEATLVSNRQSQNSEPGDNPLGLTVHSLNQELAKQYGVEMTPGVIVVGVEKGKPADRQGVKPGDIITALDKQNVTNPRQFRDAVKKANLKKGVLLNLAGGQTKRLEFPKEGSN
jgi:serine protease Do